MYNYSLHQQLNKTLSEEGADIAGKDNPFYTRLIANASDLHSLYQELYGEHREGAHGFERLIRVILDAWTKRSSALRLSDEAKLLKGHWYLSNRITGMSLYVDRWCGQLNKLPHTFAYLKDLGVNLLHLMPLFQSPPQESDGGYAVSDFRKVDPAYGSLEDLRRVREEMSGRDMYLMLDIVLNHTSHRHEWAEKAKAGDPDYQDYYYMFADRSIPNRYDKDMPDIFPESSPGNFTFIEECGKWVMTVFHHYQWDLNYRNPEVFLAMLDTIFFYANLGVDILRIDAPAFIWKEPGTTCQNLPKAHTLLRLIKQAVQISTPGMALLGEAIVAPSAILQYFGTGAYRARECDLAYNATQMALQWDALATGDTGVMLAAQPEILQKPYGASWITYTRCHDDIGLGYEDYMIRQAGYHPFAHRQFLKNYYSGNYYGSEAIGALFSVNPKTGDARISGTLASLCGLEKATTERDAQKTETAIRKILLMQAHSFFLGGIPMLFYGDEAGYLNDYSYLEDPGKNYDNRWMHRPMTDWKKNERTHTEGTIEQRIFSGIRQLVAIRNRLPVVSDHKNIRWMTAHTIHVAGYLRTGPGQTIYCLYNFSAQRSFLTWYAFKENGSAPARLYDHWSGSYYTVGTDAQYLAIEPYSFLLLEEK